MISAINGLDALPEQIDGDIAVPGMSNLHSHAFQRLFAGLAEVRPADGVSDFWRWRQLMYRAARSMTPALLEAVATALYAEMLAAGYTSVGEFHYLHNAHRDESLAMARALIRAAERTGIALTLLPVMYHHSDFGRCPPDEGQKPFVLAPDVYRRFWRILSSDLTGKNRLGVAFHSLRAVDATDIPGLLDDLGGSDYPIHIHIAEQQGEVDACIAHTGKRPVDWLMKHVLLDARWCLVHATHMTDAETDAVAASGAVAGLCLTTEANLGDGLFPAARYLAAGGAFGIGSDSHVSIDPREELRLFDYGVRLTDQRRTVLSVSGETAHSGAALWRAAAKGGARANGQPGGRLAVGARADIVVLKSDGGFDRLLSGDSRLDALVFRGQPSPIDRVMVGGVWRVKGGSALVADYAATSLAEQIDRLGLDFLHNTEGADG